MFHCGIHFVTLGDCHHLDSSVHWGSSSGERCLSLALIVVIVRGSWPFLGEESKGTLVDCSWLVWSTSCISCAAPYWGFGMWWQLVHEPPSECITTTRISLPASKWTSIKILCHLVWGFHWLSYDSLIGSILWLAHTSTHQYNHHHPLLYLHF
jgi:hypothetical protein